MRISDWSSDVCSADLAAFARAIERDATVRPLSALLVAGAAIACLAVVLLPMRRPTGDVDVAIPLEPTGEGTAFVTATQIASAACRERVCSYVSIPVVAVSSQKKKTNTAPESPY